MRAALAWILAIPLLIALMFGVGLVVAYVLGVGSMPGLVGGASLMVLVWHALRALDPRPKEDRPEESWPFALFVVAVIGAVYAVAFAWTLWVLPIAMVVFGVWARLAARD